MNQDAYSKIASNFLKFFCQTAELTNNNDDLGEDAYTINDLLWPWGFHSPSERTALPKMEQRGPTRKTKLKRRKSSLRSNKEDQLHLLYSKPLQS